MQRVATLPKQEARRAATCAAHRPSRTLPFTNAHAVGAPRLQRQSWQEPATSSSSQWCVARGGTERALEPDRAVASEALPTSEVGSGELQTPQTPTGTLPEAPLPPDVFAAAALGRTEQLQRLLTDLGPGAAHVRDEYGNTPLHVAAHHLHPEAVRLLLLAGADVNARDSEGYTPLHEAVRHLEHWLHAEGLSEGEAPPRGEAEVVELLLRAGADPHAATRAGQTPMDLVKLSSPDAARLLRHGDEERRGTGFVVHRRDDWR
ncbi:hypothetical protein HYH03_010033 [Edaphochlamys debaryana]|uniref:Uncharacterized protein n=1 Tax=Edaphochlamys debaryana TaxID=47281 RepID=A0A836BXX6_9CHLO|nr:hypothetical protein HYH03_010033 [Edaphochlamys debaryana]|eukprot:KAG2491664.1 hypothetical protein HYH03_010033 [Edaphochlamys debaryana]